MNHSMRKTALAAAVALPAVLGVQTASAALITHWNYNIDSTFSDWTETGGAAGSEVTPADPNDVLGGATTLSWGNSADGSGDRSSISVTSDVNDGGLGGEPPLLETNDMDGVPGATFRHDNNVITANSSHLSTFDLTTRIVLSAAVPPSPPETAGDGETVGPITFDGNFEETPNNEGTCVDDSESICDDIFVLSNTDFIDALNDGRTFVIGDHRYTLFLDIDAVDPLGDACDDAGAPGNCVGFLTQEDTLNERFSTVRIIATEIPAPGVLALLGVGLLGLGFAHRGRRS